MNYYKNYDFVVYCHDDVIIKDLRFVEAVEEKFQDATIQVIGNGNNGRDSEFKYKKYKNSMYCGDTDEFLIRTVRGSFFAARTKIFATIGNFPVYWGSNTLKKGNISLRNFAYLVTKHFGIESITYLNKDNWLETQFLIEFRRGVRVNPPGSSTG